MHFPLNKRKSGESYVDTIVKIIICVFVGALMLSAVYVLTDNALDSATDNVCAISPLTTDKIEILYLMILKCLPKVSF